MNHRNLILGVLLIALLVVGGMAFARSGYLTTFNGMYGTANTALDMCETCHGSSKSIRNAYGLDMEDQLNAGKTDSEALIAIENLDSDGDGYSNIDEITALTIPGATESCTNGIDDDCDGKIDCADKKDCGKHPVCN